MLQTVLFISGDGDEFLSQVIISLRDHLGKKWFKFGMCLKVSLDELHQLEKRYYHRYEMCTSRMLSKWRETYEANATWDALVTALRTIGETNLAQQLEEQHIPPERRVNFLPPAASSEALNGQAGKGYYGFYQTLSLIFIYDQLVILYLALNSQAYLLLAAPISFFGLALSPI